MPKVWKFSAKWLAKRHECEAQWEKDNAPPVAREPAGPAVPAALSLWYPPRDGEL